MRCRRWLGVFAAGTILLTAWPAKPILASPASGDRVPASASLPASPVTQRDDELIKNAIVSALTVYARNPESERDPAFQHLRTSIGRLVLLFDLRNGQRSLETLTSLASYGFGEPEYAIYQCVVVRKGKTIAPIIEQALSSRRDECVARFGERYATGGPPSPKGEARAPLVCLGDKDYRHALEKALGKIRDHETCDLNDVVC
jgi:hypothetical protein